MLKRSLMIAGVISLAQTASADEFADALNMYVQEYVAMWASDPIIIDTIVHANEVNAALDAAKVLELDATWRSEVGTQDTPTITPILTNPAADFLRDKVDASGGIISEAFIMDSRGLNAAASSLTSDMWQGDEEKFTASYGAGVGAVHIGDVEFDESTQSYLGQVSLAITDPASGALVGALTVGINAEALF